MGQPFTKAPVKPKAAELLQRVKSKTEPKLEHNTREFSEKKTNISIVHTAKTTRYIKPKTK